MTTRQREKHSYSSTDKETLKQRDKGTDRQTGTHIARKHVKDGVKEISYLIERR